ncbi:hypothetical protein Poly30_22920 [Planctomycetes bacterium Poly30]|uniref:Large, multifunctional secreted protein n=1 Tax=Saltatorellus ferox TaxID=2528018 RepID=A0A518ERR7_9BACT|nr:hypothetical protein Poly30_22920 [Planctomycetes bacterium Poly30]
MKRVREELSYPVTQLKIPADITLEVGGLCVVPGPAGPRVLAATRRGDVWGIDGFAGPKPAATPVFTRVAEGLHEPLGLLPEPDGSVAVACRGQLGRLVDSEGDGLFETLDTISDWWDISGNYHEYNFGPTRGIDGAYWITTNKPFGPQPFGEVDWRGFALKVMPDGRVKPMCAGLRSPAGVNTSPWGEVFYTDNQGEWCGASKLSLLHPGSYHGHPHGIESTRKAEWTFTEPKALPEGELYATIASSGDYPKFQMPAVWFPYDKIGRSPSGFVWDETGGAFGPFSGQMFVGDQYEAAVFRVDLERVRGHWQGACFRFRDGLASGVIRLAFTPSGALLVGESDRGWGSKGPITEGMQRIDFSGTVPFEALSVRLTPDGSGFRIRFTHRAEPESCANVLSYSLESYTYEASEKYGSDELDRRQLEVTGATPHEDGLGVDLAVSGLREGYVHELGMAGVKSANDGFPLLHATAYYTLIRTAQ